MVNSDRIVIGIRDSKLSNAQTQEFITLAEQNIDGINKNTFQIKHIKTTGDIYNTERLDKIGGKGLFVKEIESHILNGEIDIGVHSMKDMPATNHQDLDIFCFMDRLDNSDVLISNNGKTLKNLKSGSVIGTSSIRRRSQILNFRSDLNIKLLRGNVDTRLNKLKNKEYDAIILAYAGLKRLGMESEITEILDQQIFLPAGGQGVVGIQSKIKTHFRDMFSKINNIQSEISNAAERSFLKTIKANCNSPVSVCAKIDNQNVNIQSQIFSHSGELIFNESIIGETNDSKNVGSQLGEMAINQLGQDVINQLDIFEDDFNYAP
tara:strand:+ start:1890 stop:2852 length:963 start_codon:yes stop_codon:yes gene_type:complete